MLESLYDIGDILGAEKAFESDLLAPEPEDEILILSVKNFQDPPKVKDRIIFSRSEISDTFRFYFKGGNDSLVGGTMGMGGVSPFFLDKSKVEKSKIERSYGFTDYYNKNFEDDLIKNILDYLIEKEEDIKALDGDWIFLEEVLDENTIEKHRYFINQYIKAPQNKEIDWVKGICDICGSEKEIRDIRLPFFSLDIRNYNFNFEKNKVDNGHTKLCSNCELKVSAGWKYINNIFGNNYVLLPKLKNESKESITEFIRLAEENVDSFTKLNNLLEEEGLYRNLEYLFLVTGIQNQKLNIHKSVTNYKSFVQKFENIRLSQNNHLKYINAKNIEPPLNKIDNIFDLEKLLLELFVDDKNNSINEIYNNIFNSSFHFYSLYNSNLPKDMNNKFKHLLYAHRDELFSCIYESSPSDLKEKTLDKIIVNLLRYELRNEETGKSFSSGIVRQKILNSLNFYYFYNEKIYRDRNMSTKIENIENNFEEFSEKDKTKIQKEISDDPSLLYYLIGQFIRKIDDYRYRENKNKIFNDFIESLNRKNANRRFGRDILQAQSFYIEKLNPKAKFIFDIISNNMEDLFENLEFSKILIGIISGYYAENILVSGEKGDN